MGYQFLAYMAVELLKCKVLIVVLEHRSLYIAAFTPIINSRKSHKTQEKYVVYTG